MRKLIVCTLAVAALALLAPAALADSLFVTDSPTSGNKTWTGELGTAFTVGASDLSLTQAGVFDNDGDGLGGSVVWRLWQGGTIGSGAAWTQLATHTFAAGSGDTLVDAFRYYDIADQTLLAGTTYMVTASGYTENSSNYYNDNWAGAPGAVIHNTNGLTAITGAYNSTAGTNPNTFKEAGSNNFYAAAAFQYNAVPEPGTLGLLALGLATIVIVRRRRRLTA